LKGTEVALDVLGPLRPEKGDMNERTQLFKNPDLNGRRYDRFYLRDEKVWSLFVEGREKPVSFVQDINSVGMRLKCGCRGVPQAGERLHLKICLYDSPVIDCEATVRWVAEDEDRPGVYSLGLEFSDPFFEVARSWQQREVRDHVMKHKDAPTAKPQELELVAPPPDTFSEKFIDRRMRSLPYPRERRRAFVVKKASMPRSFWSSIFKIF
jgi:hypothetical protein